MKTKKEIKDPLDEIFVDYHKTIVKEEYGQWEIKKIDKDFVNWINSWADFDKHKECIEDNKRTDFGEGYKQCIKDIYFKLKLNWKQSDKRTKTGFKK